MEGHLTLHCYNQINLNYFAPGCNGDTKTLHFHPCTLICPHSSTSHLVKLPLPNISHYTFSPNHLMHLDIRYIERIPYRISLSMRASHKITVWFMARDSTEALTKTHTENNARSNNVIASQSYWLVYFSSNSLSLSSKEPFVDDIGNTYHIGKDQKEKVQ